MERSHVPEVYQTLTPEQREAVDILRGEAVTHALIKQRREICREVEQETYAMWDMHIWSELQGKVEGWDAGRKQLTCHRNADRVRQIILGDRWLTP